MSNDFHVLWGLSIHNPKANDGFSVVHVRMHGTWWPSAEFGHTINKRGCCQNLESMLNTHIFHSNPGQCAWHAPLTRRLKWILVSWCHGNRLSRGIWSQPSAGFLQGGLLPVIHRVISPLWMSLETYNGLFHPIYLYRSYFTPVTTGRVPPCNTILILGACSLFDIRTSVWGTNDVGETWWDSDRFSPSWTFPQNVSHQFQEKNSPSPTSYYLHFRGLTLVDTGWCSNPPPFLRSFARHLGWGRCGNPAIRKAHDCSFRSCTSPETFLFVMMGSQDWRFGDPRPLLYTSKPLFLAGSSDSFQAGQLYQTTSFEISWFLGMFLFHKLSQPNQFSHGFFCPKKNHLLLRIGRPQAQRIALFITQATPWVSLRRSIQPTRFFWVPKGAY